MGVTMKGYVAFFVALAAMAGAAQADTFDNHKANFVEVRKATVGGWDFKEHMAVENGQQSGVVCEAGSVFEGGVYIGFTNMRIFKNNGTVFWVTMFKPDWVTVDDKKYAVRMKFLMPDKKLYPVDLTGVGGANEKSVIVPWTADKSRDAASSMFAAALAVRISINGKALGGFKLKGSAKALQELAKCETGGETF
jgi:hypothetical protein